MSVVAKKDVSPQEASRQWLRKASWLPILVGACLMIILSMLWLFGERRQAVNLQTATRITAEQVAIRLEQYIKVRLAEVGRMRDLWKMGVINTPPAFRTYAEGLHRDLGDLQAINWINDQEIITWIVPEEGNRGALGKDLKKNLAAAPVILKARETGQFQMTPPLELMQGGWGFATYFPLVTNEKVEGYINGVFRIDSLVKNCLAQGVLDNYHVVIRDGAQLVYSSVDTTLLPSNELRETRQLHAGGRPWELIVAPQKKLVIQTFSFFHLATWFSGLILAIGVAVLMRRLFLREAKLSESEAHYRGIFEKSQVALFSVRTDDGGILHANPYMAELLGYDDIDEFIAEFRMKDKWVDPAERDRLYRLFREKGFVTGFETRFYKNNGEKNWVRFSATYYPEEGYLEGMGVDIREEKLAYEALQKSERRFRSLAESTRAAIFIVDRGGTVLYANKAIADLTGYPLSEIIGANGRRLLSPDGSAALEKQLAALPVAGEDQPHFSVEIVTRSGERRFLESVGREIETEVGSGYLVTALDVTDRKKAEQALRESEEKYRTLFENAQVGLFRIGSGGVIEEANKTMARMFGYPDTASFIAGYNLHDCFVDPADGLRMHREISAAGGLAQFEARIVKRDGSYFWCRMTSTYFPAGDFSEGVIIDVTEEKEAMEAVLQSERQYRTIFETTGTGMISFGEDSVVTLMNEVMCKLTGYSREEIVGRQTWMSFFAPESLERMIAFHHRRGTDVEQPPSMYEARIIDKLGRLHEGIVAIALLPGTSQRIASFLDITERKQAERQMLQADKMAALGQIIAGVAHEINNPNNFIYFNLPIMRRYIEALQPLVEKQAELDRDLLILNMPTDAFFTDIYKLLENMEHGSQRITGIVSELKTYIRSDETAVRAPGKLEDVIRHVMTLVGKQVRKMVKRFEVTIAEPLPPVKMNPGKIEQVLINLVINAGQAAQAKENSMVALRAAPGPDGRTVQLIVEDNGVGIPRDNIDKIFDPFFTTKGRESGTGLGLSITQRIVEEHDGEITVESRVGEGSRFTVALPIHEPKETDA